MSDINGPLPSPVPDLFIKNDAPNKFQLDAIWDVIAPARVDLRIMDDEITEVQKHLLGLQAKRAPLQSFVDEHAGLHIRRLPEELLAMIFMFTLPDDPLPSPLRPKAAPLVLGQVCKYWRAFSRNTPLLWSTIQIAPIDNEKLLAVFVRWLERAGNCSLHVLYKGPDIESESYIEQAPDIEEEGLEWDLISGLAARIEHLHVQITPDMLPLIFPADGRHGLVRLQSLCVINISDNPDEIDWTLNIGTGAPRLLFAHVDNLSLQRLDLPSGQLTTCHIDTESVPDFFTFLREATNLMDCEINVLGSADSPFKL